jgi:NADH dehydrogenase [ubiquinone] 1 alpha subcomplex assembly factor 7
MIYVADVQTLSTFPGIKDAIKRVHLVDNSEKMRAIQADKLGKRCADLGIDLTWNDQFDDVHPCTFSSV